MKVTCPLLLFQSYVVFTSVLNLVHMGETPTPHAPGMYTLILQIDVLYAIDVLRFVVFGFFIAYSAFVFLLFFVFFIHFNQYINQLKLNG